MMVRITPTLLMALVVVVSAVAAVSPTASSVPSTTTANRGRGARRAFIGRGSARSRTTTSSRAASTRSTPAAPSAFPSTPASPAGSGFRQPSLTFAPQPSHQTSAAPTFAPTFAPTLPSFQQTTFQQPFFPQQQQQQVVRIPGPSPTPRRSTAAVAFSPRPTRPAPLSDQFGVQGPAGSRPRVTPVPIIALKFNLREDGSYSTSSETGDGTVRQEHGQFNGEGMAVKGMYAYRDREARPVQVNYVADEYGFQPQGPNIHPAILMAVAEQVEAARSSKSRQGGKGLNGLLDDGEIDYDDDNGAGTTPSSLKFKSSRAVRRVIVRRLAQQQQQP